MSHPVLPHPPPVRGRSGPRAPQGRPRFHLSRRATPLLFAAAVLATWLLLIRWLAPDLFLGLTGKLPTDPHTRSRQIALAVERIDAAVVHVLGLLSPDIETLVDQQQPRTLNGVVWQSRRIEIQLPATLSSRKVARAISSIPYDTRWGIRTRTFQMEPYSETVQVSVHGYPTHLITAYDALNDPPPINLEGTHKPRVALLIDDLGYENRSMERLWSLDAPFSVAVLPFSPYALATAETAAQHLKEVLVHMPLEPIPPPDGRPRRKPLGQLTLAMTTDEIRSRTLKALRAVPYAVGVNNHEGSAFMRSAAHLRPFLETVRAERMFFVDSRTTAHSRGLELARAMGIPATDRQVFVDNDPDPDAIRRALKRLVQIARRRGAALGIGHPRHTTIDVLARWLPTADRAGIRLVRVSALTTLPGETAEKVPGKKRGDSSQ